MNRLLFVPLVATQLGLEWHVLTSFQGEHSISHHAFSDDISGMRKFWSFNDARSKGRRAFGICYYA